MQRGEGGVGLLRRSRAHDALLGAPGVPAASVTAGGDGPELPARGHADPRCGRGCWAALLLAAAAAVVVVAAGAAAGGEAVLPELLPDELIVDEGRAPEVGEHQPRDEQQLQLVPNRDPENQFQANFQISYLQRSCQENLQVATEK